MNYYWDLQLQVFMECSHSWRKKTCGHTRVIEEKNGWVLEKKSVSPYQEPNLSFSSNLKIVIAAPNDISAFYLASSCATATEEFH